MKTKHTPGPWKFEPNDYGCSITDSEGYSIAEEVSAADARLIAAAPELLECLRGVVLNWKNLNDEHFSGPSEKLLIMCKEAIAKAEGAE